MLLGYNTNGFAFHRLEDAIDIIADIGFGAVGLTLDYHALNPYDSDHERQLQAVRSRLENWGLRCVVETGARFLLDPWRKHQPTLLSPTHDEREKRIDFLRRSIRVANALGADAVSFWSGTAIDDPSPTEMEDRFAESLSQVIAEAEKYNMPLALEPEPGMFLATIEQTQQMLDRIEHPLLQLTIDVGHLHCQQEGDIPSLLRTVADELANIHIEDMRRGVHDHLMFGEGEMDFPPILAALEEIGYSRGVYVELSRHAHDAINAARQSYAFLNATLESTNQ